MNPCLVGLESRNLTRPVVPAFGASVPIATCGLAAVTLDGRGLGQRQPWVRLVEGGRAYEREAQLAKWGCRGHGSSVEPGNYSAMTAWQAFGLELRRGR